MDKELRKSLAKYDKHLNDKLRKGICCVASDMAVACTRKIIRAHTISRSLGINELAVKGHVYGYKMSSLFDLYKNEGKIIPEKIGVKNASTFKMFCAHHDKQLFSYIEDKEFPLDYKSCFLLMYRTICQEWYKKHNTRNLLTETEIDLYFNYGTELGFIDLSRLKFNMDLALKEENYNGFRHYIFELGEENNLLGSFAYVPEVDFTNQKIQSLASKDYVIQIAINSISSKGKNYIIFSWEKKFDDLFRGYIESLVTKNDRNKQARLLTNMFFKQSENIYWNINWWENLDNSQRKNLESYMQVFEAEITPNISKLKSRDKTPAFYIQDSYYLE